MHPARTALLVVAAVLAALIPAPSWAQPASACRHIPPVHHRMYGINTHRDGDGLENTIEGMRRTYHAGGRWFETDVQPLTSNPGVFRAGRMVLFHDRTLDRTTDATGPIRRLTYRELPRTTAGQRIPTLGEAFDWISRHPGTHLLVEIKAWLRWSRVIRLLQRYGFDHTRRVLFDMIGVEKDSPKHRVALTMKRRLSPYVTTGLKSWDPDRRPARYVRKFGTSIRMPLELGIQHKRDLIDAGVTTRFTKVLNGTPREPARVRWYWAVTSGAFTHIITEQTKAYLGWCARMVRRNR